jgi:prophage DNA circulation protein
MGDYSSSAFASPWASTQAPFVASAGDTSATLAAAAFSKDSDVAVNAVEQISNSMQSMAARLETLAQQVANAL